MKQWDSHTALALAMFTLLAGVLCALLFIPIPDQNRDLVIALASGVVGASCLTIVGYYFNVPKSNGQKDATIATLVDKQPPQSSTATHPPTAQ